MKKIASMTTLCASIFMATQVRSDDLTEYHCFHTCPPLVDGSICDTTFVPIENAYVSLTDDVMKATGMLKDGRLANMFWTPLTITKERMVLVSELSKDDLLGAQVAAFDFASGNFMMGAMGTALGAAAKPMSYQVVGKCMVKSQ